MKKAFAILAVYMLPCTAMAQSSTFSTTVPGFSHEIHGVGKTAVNDTLVYASGDAASVANARLLAEKFREQAARDYRTGICSLGGPRRGTRPVYVPAVMSATPYPTGGYWVPPDTYIDPLGRYWRPGYSGIWIRY